MKTFMLVHLSILYLYFYSVELTPIAKENRTDDIFIDLSLISDTKYIDDEIWNDPMLTDYETCKQVYEERDDVEDDFQSEFMDILSVEQPDSGVHDSARKTPTFLWQNGRVPAVIEEGITRNQQKRIACAVKFFEERTCVQFVKRTAADLDYLYIRQADDRGGCFSESLGKKGGRHIVNFDQYSLHCWRHGTIVHELMHAIGFFHEQARNDRDKYIQVHWENIPKTDRFKRQFMTANDLGLDQQLIGEYDYQSVMHYGRWLFSQSDPAMSSLAPPPQQSSTNEAMGNRVAPTEMDRTKINTLYQCDPRLKLPSVTVPTTVSLPTIHRSIAIFGGTIGIHEQQIKGVQNEKNELYIPGSAYGNVVIENLSGGMKQRSHTVLLLDNIVYVLGGSAQTMDVSKDDQIYNTTKKFNLLINGGQWSDGPPMEERREAAAGGVIGKNLYICGGHSGSHGILNSCEMFDTEIGQWQDIASMSRNIMGPAAAVHNDQLYIMGGAGTDPKPEARVERYNPITGEWSFQPVMASARWGHSAAIINDTIFVCGGATGDKMIPDACDCCEFVDLGSTDRLWQPMAASMKHKRMLLQLVNFNDELYAMGGFDSTGTMLTSVEKYDWRREEWVDATPASLLYANAAFCAVVLPVVPVTMQFEERTEDISVGILGIKPEPLPVQTTSTTSSETTASHEEVIACHTVGGRKVIYDPSCSEGESDGCNAGEQGQNCRFCSTVWEKCIEAELATCHTVGGRKVIYDPSCSQGESEGCNAGGQAQNCRFCSAVPQKCLDSQLITCHSVRGRKVIYDTSCSLGETRGCNAGGQGRNCRFCSVVQQKCIDANLTSCHAVGGQKVFYDPLCSGGESLGCGAGGQVANCRFCWSVPHKCNQTQVNAEHYSCRNVGSVQVTFDPRCSQGESLGCNAGAQGQNCRFCWAARDKCEEDAVLFL